MAGFYTCWSFYQNLPPANEDKLVRAAPKAAFTNDGGISSYTFTVLYVFTPAPVLASASVKLLPKYINADLQKATKLALKLFIQG